MSIDRSPAAVEAAFRESGAPWPARGEITFGSLYSTQHVLDTRGPWARAFFRADECLVEGPDSPSDPWPDGTNLTTANTYKHDFILMRVGLLFRATFAGGVPSLNRHVKLRAWVGTELATLTRTPKYVPQHTRFGAELVCDRPMAEQIALQAQVLFDCIIIVP